MNAKYRVRVSAIVLLNGLALLASASLLLSLTSLKASVPIAVQPEAVALPTPPPASNQPSALATPDGSLTVVHQQPEAVAVPTPPSSVRVASAPAMAETPAMLEARESQSVSGWSVNASPTAWRGELPLIVVALIAVSPVLWGWLRRIPNFHVHPLIR